MRAWGGRVETHSAGRRSEYDQTHCKIGSVRSAANRNLDVLRVKGAMLPPLFFSVRLPTLLAMFWRTCLRPDSIAGTAQKEPASIIIFRLDSLGDVVLTTPVFRELKKAYPKSRCTVVVQEAYRTLLVTNPHVDEVLGMPDIKPRWLPQGVKTLLSSLVLYWTRLHGRRL